MCITVFPFLLYPASPIKTREELDDRITNGKRLRIPKIMESSVEVEESSDEGENEEQEGLKRKLGEVGSAKVRKLS